MKSLSLIVLLSALSTLSYAGDEIPPALRLMDPVIEQIPLSADDQVMIDQMNSQMNNQMTNPSELPKTDPLDELDVKLDKVIAIGKKVWKVIEANKPVVNLNTSRVSALPEGISRWTQLEGWQMPTYAKYRVAYHNWYGMEVIRMEYVVSYSYGGSFKGDGRYLSQVGFTITDLKVSSLFTLNAYSEVVRVENVGTEKSPIASLEVVFHWEISTVFQDLRRAQGHLILGTGGHVEY